MQGGPSVCVLRMDFRLIGKEVLDYVDMALQGCLVHGGLTCKLVSNASRMSIVKRTSPSLSSKSGIAPQLSTTKPSVSFARQHFSHSSLTPFDDI